MKKIALICMIAAFLTTSMQAGFQDKITALENMTLGFAMNALPEECVSPAAACILFAALNIYRQSDVIEKNIEYNLFMNLAFYVAGKIVGLYAKHMLEEMKKKNEKEHSLQCICVKPRSPR